MSVFATCSGERLLREMFDNLEQFGLLGTSTNFKPSLKRTPLATVHHYNDSGMEGLIISQYDYHLELTCRKKKLFVTINNTGDTEIGPNEKISTLMSNVDIGVDGEVKNPDELIKFICHLLVIRKLSHGD